MRSPRFSLLLTAALAFGGGLAGRAWMVSAGNPASGENGRTTATGTGGPLSPPAGGKRKPGAVSGEAAGTGKAGPDGGAATGVMRDALVRKAVEGADLAAGVREIMARQEEDHCADTRLVCLVENLPAERLGELSALLDEFQGDVYVTKFILGPWAKRDPAAALAWVEAHPSLNASGMNAFLTGWTRGDPAAAVAWVDGQAVSARSANLRSALVEAMSESDPAGALSLMQTRGWISNSPDAVLKLLQNWGGRDPAGALEGLRSVSESMGLKPGTELPGQPDPFRQPHGENGPFPSLLRAMLYGAFEKNPQEAMDLVSRLTPGELAAGSAAVAMEVLARDPRFAESLFAGPQDAGARQLLLGLAKQGGDSIFSNLDRIGDPAFRQELLLAASLSGSGHSGAGNTIPASAVPTLRNAVAEITDPLQKANVIGALCPRLAAVDSGFAAELWSGLSPEEQLNGPLTAFFASLGSADVKAAVASYNSSAPEVRAVALKILSHSLAQEDPEAGLNLVLQEQDPARRADSGATLLAFWAQNNPAQAIAALEAHAGEFDLNQLLSGMSQAEVIQSAGRTDVYSLSLNEDLRSKLKEMISKGGSQP